MRRLGAVLAQGASPPHPAWVDAYGQGWGAAGAGANMPEKQDAGVCRTLRLFPVAMAGGGGTQYDTEAWTSNNTKRPTL